jgi:GGDEF domain-containing protein
LRKGALDEQFLMALGAMGSTTFAHGEDLFDHGLNLLVEHLKVDRAMVASMTGRGLENLWCAGGAPGNHPGSPLADDPNLNFCAHVMKHPTSTLVIADAGRDPLWAQHPAFRSLGVRAYLGAPLRHSGQAMGVLSVQGEAGHAWSRSEVALVDAMAGMFSKAMEVEALKVKLWQAQEALDLSSAVLEDNAMESPHTGLPTRRFLEVWCKSSLMMARRRGEIIALAAWQLPPDPGRERTLGQLASTLRGVDLLVDMSRDRFLLVLPRTLRAGAEIVLERFQQALGNLPMGATLWNPLLKPDRDSLSLQPAIRRAQAALAGTMDRRAQGGDDGEVAWVFLEPTRDNLLDEPAGMPEGSQVTR